MNDDRPLWQRGSVRLLLKVLLTAALLALLLSRWRHGTLPPDLSAYLAAAETFWAGGNPYGPALREAAAFKGYPYVYPPGTLYLIIPLQWLSPQLLGLLHALVSVGVLVGLARWARRRFLPDVPTEVLLAGLALFGPISVDLLVGNISILLLGAVAVGLASSDKARTGRETPLGAGDNATLIVAGVVLAFKAMWALPVLLAMLFRRQWRRLCAFSTGLAAIAVLSVTDPTLIRAWWAQLRRIPTVFPNSYDLLSLAPILAPLAAVAWLALTFLLLRRDRHNAGFAGALSVPAWPRLAPYSFSLMIFPLLEAIRRRPTPALALLAPMWGPFYWLWVDSLPSLLTRWLHLGWAIAAAALTAFTLLRAHSKSAPA